MKNSIAKILAAWLVCQAVAVAAPIPGSVEPQKAPAAKNTAPDNTAPRTTPVTQPAKSAQSDRSKTANKSATNDQRNSADVDGALQAFYAANGLLQRGLYELALAEYRGFLTAHPEHDRAAMARYGLAVSLFRLGKLTDALPELRELHEKHEEIYPAEVGTMLGQCLLAENDFAGAERAFAEVVTAHGSHDLADDAAAGAVEALYRGGRGREAATQSQAFGTRWSDSPLRDRVAWFGALALSSEGDDAGAAAMLSGMLAQRPDGPYAAGALVLRGQCRRTLGDWGGAGSDFRAALAAGNATVKPDAMLGLGTVLHHEGKLAEAAKLLDDLRDAHADTPAAKAAALLRARVAYDQGDLDAALTGFRAAGDDADSADQAAWWSAKCRLRRNEFTAAAQLLEDALERFPESPLVPEMMYDRAVALLRSGDPAGAVAMLRRFKERFAGHSLSGAAMHLLAVAEHQRGDYAASAAHAAVFLHDFPGHELQNQARFLAAENAYLLGEFDNAAEAFGALPLGELSPEDGGTARFRRSMALVRLGRAAEAESALAEIATNGAAAQRGPARMALGDLCFERGEWKTAEAHYTAYLAGEGELVAADDCLLKLGLARQRQGQHIEALAAFDRLLREHAQSAHRLQALFERGQVLAALGRLDEAAEAFEQVLSDGGDSRFAPHATRHLGALALARKDFSAAAERFAVLEQAGDDGDPEAAYQHGQALLAAGQSAEAAAVFQRLLAAHPDFPRAAAACARLALAQSRQNECAAALQTMERVEREYAAKLDEALRATVLYEKAWCLNQDGRRKEAAAAYTALLALDPANDIRRHAVVALAGLEMEAGRFDAAVAHLRPLRVSASAADQKPDDVHEQLLYRLGVCEFEIGHFAEAVDALEELLDVRPTGAVAHSAGLRCADALMRLNRPGDAVPHLVRIIEDEPDAATLAPALLRLGECHAAVQNWSRSEETFARFLERFPDSEFWYQARFGAGWAQEQQGRHAEAIRSYEAVIAKHQGPTAARAQFQIGECLFAGKKYEEAARALLKVDILYAYPEWSAAAIYEAGRCFELLGKPGEAREQFRVVTDKYAGTRWAELARQRLAEGGNVAESAPRGSH